MNNQQKQQVVEQIKSANNVLVTVSSNPTVDELAASVGLTLVLNKMNKRAITVFSGVVPSTIEFLQPEQTIETTTDSLRDFIIALDKAKADKLRYKVEDDVVRIFITPYRNTITDKDLDFSHGDFNVDVVLALGVTRREELDKAITAHGRILHDATVVALTARENTSELGAINWQEQQASSLCEMVASVVYDLQPEVVDGQMATALLTGIIAETDRFKNEKTTALALSLSSKLMTAGANQQLIAEKLEAPEAAPIPLGSSDDSTSHPSADGELEINHESSENQEDGVEKIHIDEHGNLQPPTEESDPEPKQQVFDENAGDTTPSNDYEEEQEPVTEELPPPESTAPTPVSGDTSDPGKELFDDLSAKDNHGDSESEPTLRQPDSSHTPMLTHGKTIQPAESADRPPKSDKPFDLQEAMQTSGVASVGDSPVPTSEPNPVPETKSDPAPDTPAPSTETPQPTDDSLAALEKSVDSPHAAQQTSTPQDQALKEAQEAVNQAAEAMPPALPQAKQDIGAQPINLEPPKPLASSGDNTTSSNPQAGDPNAPPPVPPPMTPQFYDADGSNANPFVNPNQ